MRKRGSNKSESVSALAIAGTHAVLMGMDATDEGRKGLLGFTIERCERYRSGAKKGKWGAKAKQLHGQLTFKETADGTEPESTRPIQGFRWGDYTASPGTEYRYTIVPRYGKPKRGEELDAGPAVVLDVTTERVNDAEDVHDVYFNRGAVASQAFVRAFPELGKQAGPDEKSALEKDLESPNSKARAWLSRGLEEALLGFIAKAKGKRWGLRCFFYEFNYPPVLRALGKARKRGADVHILYAVPRKRDGSFAESPGEDNVKAVKKARIQGIVTERDGTGVSIAHNKLMILLEDGEPVAVWTGSTNITIGGIFGQSNVGHVVRDPVVARRYLEYWNGIMAQDVTPGKGGRAVAKFGGTKLRLFNDEHFPVNPGGEPHVGTRPIFSPRGYDEKSTSPYEALNYYASLLNGARSGVFLTAAFGVSKEFTEMLCRPRNFLRYVLLDNPGQAGKGKTKGAIDRTAAILKDPRNRVAIGAAVPDNSLEGWHSENASPINVHVRYVHTKFMLIDPLSDYPTVISGSANFSNASTYSNDENMLVIEGNTRVADIYLTEYMRVWTQFEFRDRLSGALEAAKKAKTVGAWKAAKQAGKKGIESDQQDEPKQIYLDSTDKWSKKYYVEGSPEAMERMYFSGSSRTVPSDDAVGGA